MAKFYEPLDDFKVVELPEKRLPFWKIAGPGAILVGLSIGAGESVIWPLIAAEYGGSMIWAAALGVFLQLWINFEVGRWTIATGETVYTGLQPYLARFRTSVYPADYRRLDRTRMGAHIRACPQSTHPRTRRLGV